VPAWEVFDAALLLAALTVAVNSLRQKYPYLLVGWLWYLGMLVPVIGIVQVGDQAYADRYTYLPQIGLCIAGTWMAADWAGEWRVRRIALGGVAAVVLCGLTIAAWRQTTYWRDSEALWTHTLENTRDNWAAHNDLGTVLYQKGRTADAIAEFRKAVAIFPGDAEAHNNLANALVGEGAPEEAIAEYREALKIKPACPEAQVNLADVLLREGEVDDARVHLQEAIALHPANAGTLNKLAWMLAAAPQTSVRDGAAAVEVALEATRLSGGTNPIILRTLAAAYAEAGEYSNAVQTANAALKLAESQTNTVLAEELRRESGLYEAGRPFVEMQ
jgi:tetratricopeptide (TPR) repeat protein